MPRYQRKRGLWLNWASDLTSKGPGTHTTIRYVPQTTRTIPDMEARSTPWLGTWDVLIPTQETAQGDFNQVYKSSYWYLLRPMSLQVL